MSGVLDADPPVAGHPGPQRRPRAGQINILVADLVGHRQAGAVGVAARRGTYIY